MPNTKGLVSGSSLSDIAAAIRSKNGSTDTYTPAQMAAAISNIPAGGDNAPDRDADVVFYDYDGTILHTYSKTEFAALSEMPANPTIHPSLTPQGWNWSLADAQAYMQDNDFLDIGQVYTTADGATRLDIRLFERLTFKLTFSQTVSGGVTIDWGDESNTEMVTGTGSRTAEHTYPNSGSYTIKLTVASGCILSFAGDPANGLTLTGAFIGDRTSVNGNAFLNCYALEHVTIPNGATVINSNSFNTCAALKGIVVPGGVLTIDNNAFNKCHSMGFISLPKSVTRCGTTALANCYALERVAVPGGVLTLDAGVFSNCVTLRRVSIPDTVTTVNGSAFENCVGLKGLTLPSGMTTVTGSVCSGCLGLTGVTIQDGVTAISGSAFYNCKSLTKLTLPPTVTTIANGAFNGCTKMKAYYIMATTPPTLQATGAFSQIPADCVIYVPAGSLSAYQAAANWSTYSSYMQEMSA